MAKKVKQTLGHVSMQRSFRNRPLVRVNMVKSEETLDTFKEEVGKLVLKWLSGKLGVNKDKTSSFTQTVTITPNGPTGPNPPTNPQNINVVNVIVSCPHIQNCPYYKSDDSKK